MTEKWILAVGYDPARFGAAQTEWMEQGLLLHLVDTIEEALAALPTRPYVLIAICSEKQDSLLFLAWLRERTPIPVMILSPQDDENEREAAPRLGAAACSPWKAQHPRGAW